MERKLVYNTHVTNLYIDNAISDERLQKHTHLVGRGRGRGQHCQWLCIPGRMCVGPRAREDVGGAPGPGRWNSLV